MQARKSLTALICAATLFGCDATRDEITAPTASRQFAQQVATLTGEVLMADPNLIEWDLQCDGTGVGTVTYTAAGEATGPYPGTFTELGAITFGGDGTATFNAKFTINSTSVIQGNKQGDFNGTCTDFDAFSDGVAEYTAQIDGSTDSGISNVFMFIGVPTFTGTGGALNEDFVSSTETVVILDPPADVNPVGTNHTVTATVLLEPAHQPAPGVLVNFTVSSVSGFGATGSCTTDENGQCSFTYQGPQQPDTHDIEACAETPGFATHCGIAQKAWMEIVSTPGKVTGGGQILHDKKIHGVSFGFNAQFKDGRFHGSGVVVDHRNGTRIKLRDVTFLMIAGTHATFRGNAEIDGVPTTYTIDVDDLGEPGTMRDMFKIVTESGYTAVGILTGGNIQVHPTISLPVGPRFF